MCTVTFVPTQTGIFLSSNRDELVLRKPATPPMEHQYSFGKILFAQDGEKGGTWMGAHENGNIMVLMNGAFERHKRQEAYRESRGIIFLEIFNGPEPVRNFDTIELNDIEPFTLVQWQQDSSSLWEMRWDGESKFIAEKKPDIPQIWSSAMLYDKPVIEKREQWFDKWLQEGHNFNFQEIMKFHEFGGDGDEMTDLKMNRNGILKTVSITVVEALDNEFVMHYHDTVSGERFKNEWRHK